MTKIPKTKRRKFGMIETFVGIYENIKKTLAKILTSNSVGTQLFFLGSNQDNNRGYNFITKKKICLVHQKRKLATIEK